MTRRKTSWVLIILLLVAVSWGVYEIRYYSGLWWDYRTRPWAYSSDDNAKLLVGKWQGAFSDPDKVSKRLHLEIFEPTTEAERRKSAGKRNRRGGGIRHRDKTGFDGIATIESRLGKEEYEVYGSVNRDDYHQLKLNFRPADEQKRILPNFTASQGLDGSWQGDELRISLTFSYQRADGSSFSSSADPRYSKIAKVTLARMR